MIKVGVVGGTGYTGVELLRLLALHPDVELTAITSRGEAGMAVSDMFPSLRRRVSLKFVTPQDAALEKCDAVFFATPNGIAMKQAAELVAAGVRVIDLAADFRIRDIAEWQKWYGRNTRRRRSWPRRCTACLKSIASRSAARACLPTRAAIRPQCSSASCR